MEMPEEMSADMEDLLEQLCLKKPAVKGTTFKKPAESSSSTSFDRPKEIETAKGTLKITYATGQSYIHFQDLHGASTFLTARSAKTSKHHADEVYTLAKKLATLKHDTGPKMKEAALKLKGWWLAELTYETWGETNSGRQKGLYFNVCCTIVFFTCNFASIWSQK